MKNFYLILNFQHRSVNLREEREKKVRKNLLRWWRKLGDVPAGVFQRTRFILIWVNGRMCWPGRATGRIVQTWGFSQRFGQRVVEQKRELDQTHVWSSVLTWQFISGYTKRLHQGAVLDGTFTYHEMFSPMGFQANIYNLH